MCYTTMSAYGDNDVLVMQQVATLSKQRIQQWQAGKWHHTDEQGSSLRGTVMRAVKCRSNAKNVGDAGGLCCKHNETLKNVSQSLWLYSPRNSHKPKVGWPTDLSFDCQQSKMWGDGYIFLEGCFFKDSEKVIKPCWSLLVWIALWSPSTFRRQGYAQLIIGWHMSLSC